MCEERVQAPEDIDEAIRLLFNSFRDATYLFKDKSGLDWDHLLPGIQRAATIHFIKDRGKENTIKFLQVQINSIEPTLGRSMPRSFPKPPITPLHVINMAKFNDLILEMADDYMTNAECHPHLTAHALSMLVIAITTTYFDFIRTMATFAASCEEIAEGKYDRYQQTSISLVEKKSDSVTVDTSKWHVEENKLIRIYEFSDLPASGETTYLRVECSVDRYLSGQVATNINFYLRPYLYLRLFPKPLEDHYIKAPFTVWLVAASTGVGTREDPLLRGGSCEVQACLGDESDTVMLNVISEKESMRCVRIISRGEEITFSLYDYQTQSPVKLRLQLLNDRDFGRLYNEIRSTV